MGLLLRGFAWPYIGQTSDTWAQGARLFDRALNVDPDNVDALIEAARRRESRRIFICYRSLGWPLAAAEAKIIKALSSGPLTMRLVI